MAAPPRGYAGAAHQFMVRGEAVLAVPNPHAGEISRDLLARILRQAGFPKEQEQREDSDVDLIVDFERSVGLSRFVRLRDHLSKRLGARVDLVVVGAERFVTELAVLDYLDASGLGRSTLVIFSSDHGLELLDDGFNDKHNYYDESWRVRFILSQPGTLPEGKRAGFAIWNDITATILAAAGAGAGVASSAMPGVRAFDLYGPLVHSEPSPRRCAVATLYRSAALATRRWKLEYYYDQGERRLCDRIADPREQNDLFDALSAREARDALLCGLLAWRGDIADVDHLVRHAHGGRPVATRIASYTCAKRGAGSELRLNERVERRRCGCLVHSSSEAMPAVEGAARGVTSNELSGGPPFRTGPAECCSPRKVGSSTAHPAKAAHRSPAARQFLPWRSSRPGRLAP